MPRIDEAMLKRKVFDWQRLLALKAAGYEEIRIAQEFRRSHQTIEIHLTALRHAFGARSAIELVGLAASAGRIPGMHHETYRKLPWRKLSPFDLAIIELKACSFRMVDIGKSLRKTNGQAYSSKTIEAHMSDIFSSLPSVPRSAVAVVARWACGTNADLYWVRPGSLLYTVLDQAVNAPSELGRIGKGLALTPAGIQRVLAECAYKLELDPTTATPEQMLERAIKNDAAA